MGEKTAVRTREKYWYQCSNRWQCEGKHCVIGANSVVTKDVLDYCVAVGSPARVIKRIEET